MNIIFFAVAFDMKLSAGTRGKKRKNDSVIKVCSDYVTKSILSMRMSLPLLDISLVTILKFIILLKNQPKSSLGFVIKFQVADFKFFFTLF